MIRITDNGTVELIDKTNRGPEREQITPVIKALRDAGFWCWRTNSTLIKVGGVTMRGSPRGTPQILGVLSNGCLFGIFVKSKLNKRDQRWASKAKENRVGVLHVYEKDPDLSTAIEYLKEFEKGGPQW